MSKCEHNEIISFFCISQHCQSRQVAGCQQCMTKYHTHIGTNKFLSEDQIQSIIRKFTVQQFNNLKPNCRQIQQSLYAYFNAIKTQFAQSIDLLCKTIINQLTATYLSQNNIFTVYKRIKSKQYKRLHQKQFKKLLQLNKKCNFSELPKEQAKLYKQCLRKDIRLISSLENVMTMYETLFKQLPDNTFKHDKTFYQGLNSIMKQTIQNAQGTGISLGQFHKEQLEKNRLEKTQNKDKTQKPERPDSTTKKPLQQKEQFPSSLFSSQHSRLPSNSSTKQKNRPEPIILSSFTKKQDNSQSSQSTPTPHKFGVRDFIILQKDKSQLLKQQSKRPSSLDRKYNTGPTAFLNGYNGYANDKPSVSPILFQNTQKKNWTEGIDDFANKDKSYSNKGNEKALDKKTNQKMINDFFESHHHFAKKPQKYTINVQEKKQALNPKEKQIHQRKQQLIEMMKNHSMTFSYKKDEKQKQQDKFHPKNNQTAQSSNHTFGHHHSTSSYHPSTQSEFAKNHSLLYKPFTMTSDFSTQHKKNPPMSAEQKKHSNIPEGLDFQKIQALGNFSKPFQSKQMQSLSKSIPHINEDSNSSQGSLQVIKKFLPKKNMNAHPKLPIEQTEQKQKQIGCSRLIIVPTNQKFLSQKSSQLDSPLLKKKINLSSKTPSSNQSSRPHQPKPQLPESQQKSLALLIQSIHLKPQQAIKSLQLSLKQSPNNLSAAQYLSYLYLQNSRPKQALVVCNSILDRFQIITKENQELLIVLENNKAAALNQLGRYSEVIVLLERAIKIKQKDTMLKNLADAYQSISNYEKALFYYEKTLKLSPNYDQASYNMAVCLFLQNNFHNARSSIQKALQTSPRHPEYLQLKKHIDQRIKEQRSTTISKKTTNQTE